MDWTDFFSAIALVLILEGIMPFANPAGMRKTLAVLASLDDRTLRTAGLISMVAGLVFLLFVRFE